MTTTDFLAECDAALDEEIASLHLRLRGVYAGGERTEEDPKENEYDLAPTS